MRTVRTIWFATVMFMVSGTVTAILGNSLYIPTTRGRPRVMLQAATTPGTNITKTPSERKWTVLPKNTMVPSAVARNATVPATLMRVLPTAPTLDRAHKNKLLVEAPCGKQCNLVTWRIKEVAASSNATWMDADSEVHPNFPNTFYLRNLRPDTAYLVRGLLHPSRHAAPYEVDDVPTLEARTCPEKPPPVSNIHTHSAGPGWLEVRWTPPAKETCKSHLFYQARYAPHGSYFSSWRTYGFFRNERWVHFRPTHPCAVWPREFCMLLTDSVKPGEQHVIEVRVSRFDELTLSVSDSRKIVVRADVACIATDTCGDIGGAPVSAAAALPNVTAAADEVDVDDADITTQPTEDLTNQTIDYTTTPYQKQGAAAHRSGDKASASDSSFGRLAPLFLALLLLAIVALPAAFFWGKRRGRSEAVDLHMLPAWKRRCGGDGGSQPVLAEEVDDEDQGTCAGATLRMDQHGRYSWAKLGDD